MRYVLHFGRSARSAKPSIHVAGCPHRGTKTIVIPLEGETLSEVMNDPTVLDLLDRGDEIKISPCVPPAAKENPNMATKRSKYYDAFTQAYLETALWSSTDESDESGGEPLNENYSISDIDPATLDEMVRDAESFQLANWDLISSDLERAGGDFWLTRNRHGTGFWDGAWLRPDAKILTDEAHAFGSFDLYVGDDGMIYGG